MDLVAGDAPDIVAVIGSDELVDLDEPGRFAAHLALGGGLDPTWLDLFSEAVRAITGADEPVDFIDARLDYDSQAHGEHRSVERVDPGWVSAVALVPDRELDAIAGRWIDLIEDELGALPREEKPWIRELAGRVVAFCRVADRAPDVLFAFALR